MVKNTPIVICLASDTNYVPYLYAAMRSILKNADVNDSFRFYILDNGITEEGKKNISELSHLCSFEIFYIPVNTKLFSNVQIPKGMTATTFCRFFIPGCVPEDKVLYLDCDIMARSSLAELYNFDIGDNYIAGVLDYYPMSQDIFYKLFDGGLDMSQYVNCGVLLTNNKKWREDNLAERLMEITAKNDFLPCYDQDPINLLCQGKKAFLPTYWNVQSYLYRTYIFKSRPDFEQIVKERDMCRIRHFHPLYKNSLLRHRNEYLDLFREGPYKHLIPKDDPRPVAMAKQILRYIQKDPACMFKPSFYKNWIECGTVIMFDGSR